MLITVLLPGVIKPAIQKHKTVAPTVCAAFLPPQLPSLALLQGFSCFFPPFGAHLP